MAARGLAYAGKGRHDLAIQDFIEAIKLDPGSAQTLYDRGMSHGRLGAYDKALDDFNAALRIQPDHGDALSSRAFALMEFCDYAEALRDFYIRNLLVQVHHRDQTGGVIAFINHVGGGDQHASDFSIGHQGRDHGLRVVAQPEHGEIAVSGIGTMAAARVTPRDESDQAVHPRLDDSRDDQYNALTRSNLISN